MPGARTRRHLHYAWIVAAVTFLVLLTGAGFRSAPSVLIVPLQKEFGWDRATISLAVSINLVLYGFSGIFAAALMERFGIRRVTVAALLLVGSGAALTTLMRVPWQLHLLWGLVVGVGTGAIATVMAAAVAGRWFVKRRGLVVGILSAASATGNLIFLPLLAWLAVHYGWRMVSLTVAGAAALVTPVIALLMRDRPSDVGLAPYGADAGDVPPPSSGSPIGAAFGTLGQVWRSRDFWFLAGSFFICGASTNGLIGTHLIPASIDHGMAEVSAAGLLALIGIFDIAGTTLSGWLTDRWDSRWLLFWYYGLRGLSLLFLPYAFGSAQFGLPVFIVFYGLDWVATVPPTVALASDLFGKQRGPIVFGWVFAAHMVGAAVAAYGAGAARTWFGNYEAAFMTAGVICLVASGMVIRIGRQPWALQPVEPLAPAPVASGAH
jgi:sugar phosphate permease